MKGGYDTNIFTDENSTKEYICSICTNVSRNASTTDCEHIFCSGCIGKWLQQKQECPCCRKANPVVTANKFVDKLILELKVNKKRKHDGYSMTLKERIKDQKWCSLCWQETDHEVCPNRSVNGSRSILDWDAKVRAAGFGSFGFEAVFPPSSRLLETELIELEKLESLAENILIVSNKWTSMSVKIDKATNRIIVGFSPFRSLLEKYSVCSIQWVPCITIYRKDKPNMELVWSAPSTLTADDFSKIQLSYSTVLKQVVNELMDMECVSFSVVSFCNFICKPVL